MPTSFERIYRDRSVLVTGHTGFKGSWLSSWLHLLGARVHGIALAPDTTPNLFSALDLDRTIDSAIVDIRSAERVAEAVQRCRPDIVFHLAAQPLVRKSYADPIETFQTNVVGTASVLEACRSCESVRAVVCVTTDKVYLNRELNVPFGEDDRLGGYDPYSASKACAELVAFVYQQTLRRPGDLPRIATARGGNVIGGGDWCADRIVPDIVRAIAAGAPLKLRNPGAVRPWQHVLELCEAYLELGARLFADEQRIADSWNIGPEPNDVMTVGELVKATLAQWRLPDHPVTTEASPLHEAQLLRLDISKALEHLHWRPRLGARNALSWTVDWYRNYYDDPAAARALTLAQIQDYQQIRSRPQ